MNTKHKHYDVIVAWATGEQIEVCANEDAGIWVQIEGASPAWHEGNKYRIKPKPEYPTTLMDHNELYNAFTPRVDDRWNSLTARNIANAAIRHAIDSGQVIIAPKGE